MPTNARPASPGCGWSSCPTIRGEIAGLQFAHLGADVIKVEPPAGRPRATRPVRRRAPDPERSLAYWYYNGGKRSVVVDLDDEGGPSRSEPPGRRDVSSTLHPNRLRGLGLDLAALSAAIPALIVCRSPLPPDRTGADYQSCDLVALATSGLLITSGYDDHSIPPIRPGGDQAFHTAASFAQMPARAARTPAKGGRADRRGHARGWRGDVELANPYWFYPRVLVQRQTCRHAQPVPPSRRCSRARTAVRVLRAHPR